MQDAALTAATGAPDPWASSYIFTPGFKLSQNASVHVGSDLLVMQSDGNLALYQGSTPLWATGTNGQNCGANQCYAVFQSDGNFVIYNGATAICATETDGNYGARLTLSSQAPYIEVVGTLRPAFPAKEYVRLNGQVIAIENN